MDERGLKMLFGGRGPYGYYDEPYARPVDSKEWREFYGLPADSRAWVDSVYAEWLATVPEDERARVQARYDAFMRAALEVGVGGADLFAEESVTDMSPNGEYGATFEQIYRSWARERLEQWYAAGLPGSTEAPIGWIGQLIFSEGGFSQWWSQVKQATVDATSATPDAVEDAMWSAQLPAWYMSTMTAERGVMEHWVSVVTAEMKGVGGDSYTVDVVAPLVERAMDEVIAAGGGMHLPPVEDLKARRANAGVMRSLTLRVIMQLNSGTDVHSDLAAEVKSLVVGLLD